MTRIYLVRCTDHSGTHVLHVLASHSIDALVVGMDAFPGARVSAKVRA